ncbi:unnamed protein product (macronuclear) [Paramecium tetraurelia]|uniref:Uncharacterized protein n=1 Tax=Paramecium tetraurelia TaxID=5888 RepID=A0CAR9_PARTE|nr:uncharacterized protein GSPATT00036667001 [Paramecium tetraurelia]CAK67886.1 unnamed protein product [Paramecium tetraurelia]|eukprot:XP_001435283.1 hypothetical protein (macronuclear) [Paramecium tetraurelia strain d4-2]
MDNGKIINFQDFDEIECDQEYMALTFSNNNKKLKNYEKALEKFKSSIQQGFIYINSNLDFFNLNSSHDGILIDEQNNKIQVIDEPIIGTQLVLKKDKTQLLNDRKRHLINIDPHSYKIDVKTEEKDQDKNGLLNKIDQMIKEEKVKAKKKNLQKKQ